MNRFTRSEFLYSTIGHPVLISGKQTLTTPVAATLVNQGVTLTAVLKGTSGNSITYAITGGATAGAEVVSVTGNAISIQIESGVSTVTQVRTALNASTPAAALITATGTDSATVASPLAATNLSGGDNGIGTNTFGEYVSSVTRTGVGEYTVTLAETYNAAKYIGFRVLAATAVDLIPQIKSQSMSDKTIVVKLLTGATATDIAADTTLIMDAILNASSISY